MKNFNSQEHEKTTLGYLKWILAARERIGISSNIQNWPKHYQDEINLYTHT